MEKTAAKRLLYEFRNMWCQYVDISTIDEFVEEYANQPQEEKLAMNIVNQLYDLAEVPVDKRQSINDKATAFVLNLLRSI